MAARKSHVHVKTCREDRGGRGRVGGYVNGSEEQLHRAADGSLVAGRVEEAQNSIPARIIPGLAMLAPG